MVSRYGLQIDERERPNARMADTGGPAAYGAQVAQSVGGLGNAAGYAGQLVAKKQFDRAKLDANNAGNAYQKALTQYLYDPDSGVYAQRKLGDADNATLDFDAYAEKLGEEIAAGLSPEAGEMFQAMAGDIRMPFWKQTSVHEAKEMAQFREGSYKATIAEAIDTAAIDPGNDELFQLQLDKVMLALGELNLGASEDVLKQAFRKVASEMETARIARVAATDPAAAQEMIEGSPYLLEETRTKLFEKNEGDVRRLWVQEAVDGLIDRYGVENPDQVLSLIRREYGGREQDELASAYKTRVGELTIREGKAEAELRKRQEENWERLYLEYYSKGENPPAGMLDKMLEGGELSWQHHHKAREWDKAAVTRAEITKKLMKDTPDWNFLSQQQREELVMRKAGRAQEERDNALAWIKAGIMDPDEPITRAEIADAYQNMYITKPEMERFLAALSGKKAHNNAVVKQHQTALAADLSQILQKGAFGDKFSAGDLKAIAKGVYLGKVAELDPDSKTYAEDVKQARRDAITAVVEATGKDLERWRGVGGIGKIYDTIGMGSNWWVKTPFGEKVGEVESGIDASPIKGYAPEFRDDPINLSIGDHAAANAGTPYEYGGKDINRKVDCSGLVTSVGAKMMDDANRAAGREVFDAAAKKALTGASADIIENVSKATGYLRENPTIGELRGGMLIGLNASSRSGGRGFKGIDHIAVIYRDPMTSQLKVYESNGKQGVVIADASEYLERYRKKGAPTYLVDPLLMAKGRETKNPLYARPKPQKQANPYKPVLFGDEGQS